MENQVQAKMNQYLQMLQDIRQHVSDDQVAIAILQEVAKDLRMNKIRQEKDSNMDSPATEKQSGYLKNLGVDASPGLSKRQASRLIDEMLAKPKVSVEKVPGRVP